MSKKLAPKLAPWSVKGVSEEARCAAKVAAAASGQNMGDWLSSLILEQTTPKAQKPSPAVEAREKSPSERELATLVLDLARRVSSLESRSLTLHPVPQSKPRLVPTSLTSN